MKRILIACALALALPLAALAQKSDRASWIHIQVIDDSRHGANVEVNLPMSLVEVALEVAEDEMMEGGHIEIDADITVSDMRRMWHELREAGDGDFVTVEEDGERVEIYRRGDLVHIDIDDVRRDEQKIRLEIPVSMVDVLFDTEEEHALNLRGALAELQNHNGGEVLNLRDGDETVRIWID